MLQNISQQKVILYLSIYLTLFYNYPMFSHTIEVYGFDGINKLYILSIAVVLTAVINVVLNILAFRILTKPVLIITIIASSLALYFMESYKVIIDSSMIRNALETNVSETLDLINSSMLFYLFFYGILPAYILYKTQIKPKPLLEELFGHFKAIFYSLVVIILTVFAFSKFYTSFFREHKELRYYSNPTYWIYSIGKYIHDTYGTKYTTLKQIGLDAHIDDNKTRTIVFMVVGEAARADHFSLNGYTKNTTPKLLEQNLINYPKAYSCGTSTAHSVPCMFSIYTRDNFSFQKAKYTENVLDVLKHTNKVAILWRDNNSDSKGVALRVAYEDFKSKKRNKVCDVECRDIGMLDGLKTFIKKNKSKHILIVLHQMGNHGPAYYKRYPKNYEKFHPTCKTNQLEQCTNEEISNAYDNALYYTDNFLNQTIELAKQFPNDDVAVVYMSDHGESLGEGGIYLHGLPYFIAPDAQKHIGAFLWLNKKFKQELSLQTIKEKAKKHITQDSLFHTLLGLFSVKTSVYNKKLDLVH